MQRLCSGKRCNGNGHDSRPRRQREGEQEANSQLGRKVRAALAKTQGIDVSNIAVRARGGAVTLTGSVPDQGQIDAAGEAAKGVAGVTSVSNKLNVMQQ